MAATSPRGEPVAVPAAQGAPARRYGAQNWRLRGRLVRKRKAHDERPIRRSVRSLSGASVALRDFRWPWPSREIRPI
jgi:hypothetical protein